jgi:hypothetical protein
MTAFQTFTTLILAGIGAYIAWRQWRTAQDRLILDLFERRFQVFQDLTRTVSATFADKPNVEVQDITKFDTAIERARFLFGPEVHSYLTASRQQLMNMIVVERLLRDRPDDGPLRTKVEDQALAVIDERNEFYGRLATLVTPYMRVGQPADPWRSLLDHVQGARQLLRRRWRSDKR